MVSHSQISSFKSRIGYVLLTLFCINRTLTQAVVFEAESDPITLFHKSSFTKQHLLSLRNQTKELFYHGWDSYMTHGFPADEIRPISCQPYERDQDVSNIHRNDVLGNYSVTFLDTLTTFAIMGEVEKFAEYIVIVKDQISLNNDATVQVFETTIRALGSLLSCHLFAADKFKFDWYDGFLLTMAHELGVRLLDSFVTTSGIPLPRVNLKNGILSIPDTLNKETCSAGAGSPILEMTLLSVLTNDTRFEDFSRNAYFNLWDKRSKLDLLPMTVDSISGAWMDSVTGIGASIDSFYEYALKGYILFQDEELLDVWQRSYRALATYSKTNWFYTNVHVDTGQMISPWIDALGAFFPGLLTLAGNVREAATAHRTFLKLWNKYGGIPERWDFLSTRSLTLNTGEDDPVSLEWYPLRPEFIESTYYLYQATKDPLYLRIGERVLQSYQEDFKVRCGFAGYRDIRNGTMQDRMESFVLSETFMYLYLLFDESNALNSDVNMIFSTEGHPLWCSSTNLNQYREFQRKKFNEDFLTLKKNDKSEESDWYDLLRRFQGWPKKEMNKVLDFLSGFFQDKEDMDSLLETVSLLKATSKDIQLTSIDKDLLTCQAPQKSIFTSNLMDDINYYEIDSIYWSQWKSSRDFMDSSSDFHSIHVNQSATCQRESSLNTLLVTVGLESNVKNNKLEYFSMTQNNQSKKSLWVHDLEGLRLNFEVLKVNNIDSLTNKEVTNQDLQKYTSTMTHDIEGICSPEDEKLSEAVLRVRTINGIEITDPDSTVFIAPENQVHRILQNGKIKFTGNSAAAAVGNEERFLSIYGLVVINMKIWGNGILSNDQVGVTLGS
ncbi:hypothetical protein WICPIJ_004667 [Wickerhamomyces pijperi]|uniref:alpha-1,2-Mannosidase n=1 Tax=Wickerhamomyces pijperi TaxID=599730 RepID=A0A9P8Q522_WICPI|nr:hypothetical protein WICPIJ_004667 [Wickerhamomyces pijperi]